MSTTHTARSTRDTADACVRDLLAGAPADERPHYEPLSWDILLGDLYRAADQTWNVDLIDTPTLWAVIWVNRHDATNTDRAEFVRAAMDDLDMGHDVDVVREYVEAARVRNRPEYRTYAVPFTGEHMAMSMTPAEYDAHLDVAVNGDQGHRAYMGGAGLWRSARGLFDVLVLA